MTQTAERPGISERYALAARSSDLTVNPDARTDADVLLAAGYAAAGNEYASLALRFWRIKETKDLGPFRELAEIAGRWLQRRSVRGQRRRLNRIQAIDLATRTLFWWIDPVCKPCAGRGHPLRLNSPVIDTSRDCPTCHGTGKYPIHRVVPPGASDEACWLTDELDRYCRVIFDDMARLLRVQLDF
jgi:hypothetical protein